MLFKAVESEWENTGCVNGREDDFSWWRELAEKESVKAVSAAGNENTQSFVIHSPDDVNALRTWAERTAETGEAELDWAQTWQQRRQERAGEREELVSSLRRQGLRLPLAGTRNIHSIRAPLPPSSALMELITLLVSEVSDLCLLTAQTPSAPPPPSLSFGFDGEDARKTRRAEYSRAKDKS